MPEQKQPHPAAFFQLILGNSTEQAGVFRKCSGASFEIEIAEHKAVAPNGRAFTRKVPVSQKFGDVTLERGIDENQAIWQWIAQVKDKGADGARVNGQIKLIDITGSTIATYAFTEAFPKSYKPVDFDAGSNNIAVESLTLVVESFERVS